MGGEAFKLEHGQAVREVDGTARPVEPARERPLQIGLELQPQVIEPSVLAGALREHRVKVGQGRHAPLDRSGLCGRGRELNENAPLKVGQGASGRDEFAEDRHHGLDPFRAVVARERFENRKGIQVPDVVLVEDEKRTVEDRAGLFVGATHVDDPHEAPLGEAAEGELVHDDGLARAGFPDDRHGIVPARVCKGVDVHDLPAAAHKGKERRAAVAVVPRGRPLPLGHDGRAADAGRERAPLNAKGAAHVFDEQGSGTHRKSSHQGLGVEARRAAHVHAGLARDRLAGVHGLGLKRSGRKEQILVRHPRDAALRLKAVDGDRPLAGLLRVPGADLRNGRVRHLQRPHAVALGLDALGGGVEHRDDARKEKGAGNLMAAAPELAQHL